MEVEGILSGRNMFNMCEALGSVLSTHGKQKQYA